MDNRIIKLLKEFKGACKTPRTRSCIGYNSTQDQLKRAKQNGKEAPVKRTIDTSLIRKDVS